MTKIPLYDNFYRGKISWFVDNWRQLTSDQWIIEQVMGVKVQITSDPSQAFDRREISFPASELKLVEAEVSALEKKGVIYSVDHDDGE